jgi:hypothetical protein
VQSLQVDAIETGCEEITVDVTRSASYFLLGCPMYGFSQSNNDATVLNTYINITCVGL